MNEIFVFDYAHTLMLLINKHIPLLILKKNFYLKHIRPRVLYVILTFPWPFPKHETQPRKKNMKNNSEKSWNYLAILTLSELNNLRFLYFWISSVVVRTWNNPFENQYLKESCEDEISVKIMKISRLIPSLFYYRKIAQIRWNEYMTSSMTS